MTSVFVMAIVQGFMGCFDSLYYHEWRLRLREQSYAEKELLLHGIRDLLYGTLYLQLAVFDPYGLYSVGLLVLLAGEVVVTLVDFLTEDKTRVLPAGERVMHSLIAILFGAFIAVYVPILLERVSQPSAVVFRWHWLSPLFLAMVGGACVLAWRDFSGYFSLRSRNG